MIPDIDRTTGAPHSHASSPISAIAPTRYDMRVSEAAMTPTPEADESPLDRRQVIGGLERAQDGPRIRPAHVAAMPSTPSSTPVGLLAWLTRFLAFLGACITHILRASRRTGEAGGFASERALA
jgi:hypothetical protein